MSEPEIDPAWVEAAVAEIGNPWETYKAADHMTATRVKSSEDLASAALSAAYPLIERALKAEALREAADDLMRQGVAATPRWLRDRADALEEA